MQPDIPLLQQTILFSGIEAEELRHLLTCLGGSVRRYGRGEFLWHAGDTVLQAGIVLQGAVDAVQYREDGAMQLVARHTAGGVFGEMLMAAGEASPVSVLSPEGAEVLFLPLERIMEGCERHCEGHARLRMNLPRSSGRCGTGSPISPSQACGGGCCCICKTAAAVRDPTASGSPCPERRWRRIWR